MVGGANLDVVARPDRAAVPATSNPGRVQVTAGGVGRNVAENLARLGTPTSLVSSLGAAEAGQVLAPCLEAGVDVAEVRRMPGGTSRYVALLDAEGELVGGVADMSAIQELGPDDLPRDLIASAGVLVLDGNLRPDTLAAAWGTAADAGVPVVVDPVSVPKAQSLSGILGTLPLWVLSVGTTELAALGTPFTLLDAADLVWERRGPDGSRLYAAEWMSNMGILRGDVVDVTGAGDAMLAAFCHATLAGAEPEDAQAYAHATAALTVASPHTVRPDLTDELVRSLL